MDLIDANGDLLGYANAVDALAVVVTFAVLIAGVTAAVVATGAGGPSAATDVEPTDVTLRAVVAPYVADAIEAGPVPTGGVHAVESVAITDRSLLVTVNRSGRNVSAIRYRVALTVELAAETGPNGFRRFRGRRLYVGRDLRLDLGTTVVNGTVSDVG